MSENNLINICRPIRLYNKHVPATDVPLKCDIVTFGEHDGITVGENIFIMEGNRSHLFDFWLSLVDESRTLIGQYVTRTIFAFRSETGDEYITDEDFFSYENLPFFFLVMLQYKEYRTDLPEYMRHLEEHINKAYAGDLAKAVSYLTMDNSDIILLIKSKTYDIGRLIINDLHHPDNVFHASDGGTLTLNNSFSIVGFSKSVLESGMDLSPYDSHIDQVMFCAMEKAPGTIRSFREELRRTAKIQAVMYDNLGNDDEILIWNDANWRQLLPLYRSCTNTCKTGLLIDEYPDYLNWFHSVVTVIRASESKNEPGREPQVKLGLSEREIKGGEILNQQKIQGVCGQYRMLVKKNMPEVQENQIGDLLYDPMLTTRLALGKTLLHILNALEKFERTDFPCYLFVSIVEPLKQFIRILYSGGIDHMEQGNMEELQFLNSINILIQNPNGIDRQFLQAPDFNAGIFNVPVKLEAFYSAYVYYVTKLYNSLKTDEKNKHTYKFLLCPWVEKHTNSSMMFPQTPPGNRVILIQVPEQLLFNPKCLMIILCHEVGHFVGGEIRMRDVRHQVTLVLIADSLVQYWVSSSGLNEFITDAAYSKCVNTLIEMLNAKENEYYDGDEIEKDYKYHSHYMKKNLRWMVREVFENSLEDLKEIIKADYISLPALQNQMPEYYSFEEFKKKNEETLKEIQAGLYNFESIWNKAAVQVLGNNSYIISGIVDNIMDNMIECFADLISIIALDLSPRQYLESFFSTLEEVQDAAVIIRLCLVVQTMRTEYEKSPVDHISWVSDWNELVGDIGSGRLSSNLEKLVDVMYKIMLQLDIERDPTLDFISKDGSYEEYRLFERRITWDLIIVYLRACKNECEKFLPSEEPVQSKQPSEPEEQDEPNNSEESDSPNGWKKRLRSIYKIMGEIESIENTITGMEEIITDYTVHVFEKHDVIPEAPAP